MPDYVTSAEAQAACADVKNVWNVSGVFTEARLLVDLNAVEGEINAAVQSRYTIPVTDSYAKAYLKGICIALLRAKAYSNLAAVETPEVILQEARAARGQLRDISSGRLELASVAQKDETGLPQYLGYVAADVTCSRTKLEKW
jgi:uncharacterized transporter YbjL